MKRMPVSEVRALSSRRLRELPEAVVVFSHSTPVAVLLPYAEFVEMRKALKAARAVTGGIVVEAVEQ